MSEILLSHDPPPQMAAVLESSLDADGEALCGGPQGGA